MLPSPTKSTRLFIAGQERNVLTKPASFASFSLLKESGGIAQLVEQAAHIRSVIGSSPIAAIKHYIKEITQWDSKASPIAANYLSEKTKTVSAPPLLKL